MFCFTLCYGCSKKEERETLAEVQTIEEDSKEPQKSRRKSKMKRVEQKAEDLRVCMRAGR